MTINNKYRGLQPVFNKVSTQREISIVVNNMLAGHLNCIGEVTIKNGTTSTVVEDNRVTDDSVVYLMALDANSADTSTFWFDMDKENKRFTINHDNSGKARSYRYSIFG